MAGSVWARSATRLANLAPDFDPRSYGVAKLSDLVRKSGAFEIDQSEGRRLARAPEARNSRDAKATPTTAVACAARELAGSAQGVCPEICHKCGTTSPMRDKAV